MSRTILMVAPYLPVPANFGGALRIFNLLKHLAETHKVILLAPGSESDLAAAWGLHEICDVTLVPARSTSRQAADHHKRLTQLQSFAGGKSFLELSSYNPQLQAALDRLFMTRSIDLVQLEFPETSLYTLPRPVPAVFDAHNVEHDLLQRVAHSSVSSARRAFNLIESRKVRRLEISAWDRATVCVATSESDAERMRCLTSTRVEVVPNGVDLEAFGSAQQAVPQAGHVVFTGAMRHQPNADGASWYAREVHPLVQRHIPTATLSIVGADPPAAVQALSSTSIEVTGEVDDVRPYLGAAQVVAVPLWSGGGTRLKILEAFAAGRPVVSTTIGAEGIDARDGEHLLLADSPQAFAQAIVRLSEDRELADRLAFAGRQLVEERYGWDRVSRKLIEIHDQLLGDGSGA